MKVCVYCDKQFPDELQSCPQDGHPLHSATAQEDPFLGRIIMDRYRVLRLLGRGGMGAVYEGRHTLLDRQVAIKVMHQNILADETAVARFIREAKTAAMLEHPNAVMVYDFGVLEDAGAFIVMEFINGSSLRQLLLKTGALSLKQALSIFAPVCSAVEAAHRLGIIHRDLKPENIMLKEADDGTLVVKVVDFGLAKIIKGENNSAVKLTQTGQIMGTPYYMAPEIFEVDGVDHRVDIYALGVIFYEMLTGSPPHTGSLEAVIAGHMMRHPQPISTLNPAVNPHIDEVLRKALHKKPQERTGSAMELLAGLQAGLTGDTTSSIVATSTVEDLRDTLINTRAQPVRSIPLTKAAQERQTLAATVSVEKDSKKSSPGWKRVLIAASIFGLSSYAGISYLNRPVAAPAPPTTPTEAPKVVITEPPAPVEEEKPVSPPKTSPKPAKKPVEQPVEKPNETEAVTDDDSPQEDEYETRRKERWLRNQRKRIKQEMRERYRRLKAER